MDILSLVGIVVGLVLLIALAYKGHSIIWVAPVCAVVVAVFGGLNLLDAYMVDYMSGAANFVLTWFPSFFLGAVFGKMMDDTGAARALADKLVGLFGTRFALLSVVLPCMLMTYGGVSMFVVVFVIYPLGYEIYRRADISRTLIPGAIGLGAFTITMTAIPGSPQIQNIIPTEYYGTSATAAPLIGLVGAILIGVPGYIYLDWRIRSYRKKGIHFEEDPRYMEKQMHAASAPDAHWLCGLIPLVVVVLVLNVLPIVLKELNVLELTANQALIAAMVCGILVTCLMNLKRARLLLPAINGGAESSLPAIMNTACAVGFGSVVKMTIGFTLLKTMLIDMPGSILFSEAVAVNVLAGATGSASGGMGIALEALSGEYMAAAAGTSITPDILHRIASLASGGLDTLPHNGAILTVLAASNCTHKQSYWDICVTSCIIPVVVSIGMSLVLGIFL